MYIASRRKYKERVLKVNSSLGLSISVNLLRKMLDVFKKETTI